MSQNMNVLKMTEQDLTGRRVLIREDLNVPIKGGMVASDARVRAALPTIQAGIEAGARVMLMSHLGRPTEGEFDSAFSLAPVAQHLGVLLGQPVRLVPNWLNGVEVDEGEVVLCENVRFNLGEKASDEVLSKKMAALCDLFVMDAFGASHRAQATTEGVARYAPVACAGLLLVNELKALETAIAEPAKPVVAIVGGSKVSNKLEVLDALSEKVDQLVVGGGIANTFLAATGCEVGQSLYEPDLVEAARALLNKVEVPIPTDVVTATSLNEPETATIKSVEEINSDDMILDIGPETRSAISQIIGKAATIIWNGPVGAFERDEFAEGTKSLVKDIADNIGFSIAGGGDTLAAIDKYGIAGAISYISTGGGAFLEFVEGKKLPAVAVLERRAANRI